MSRIGKQIINIPAGVTVNLSDVSGNQNLKIKGPLGEVSRDFKPSVAIKIEGSEIKFVPESDKVKALWGTYAAHVKNMVKGVTEGFKKVLQLEGIGFKAQLAGDKLTMSLGFSHPVIVQVPKGLKMAIEKNIMTITGIDIELVGLFACRLVALKKPEPYKGKGIRYEGQVIKLKEGKKATA